MLSLNTSVPWHQDFGAAAYDSHPGADMCILSDDPCGRETVGVGVVDGALLLVMVVMMVVSVIWS